jgi:acetoacetate decarboxylase
MGYLVYTCRMDARTGYWRRLIDMVAPGDWLYRDAHYLVAEMEVDPVAARRWVPHPLRLVSPARASLFTAWFPMTTIGSVYREAGLFLHVEHRGTPAVFSPWMIVDDDVALISGRELLGYPKKLGSIEWTMAGDEVHSVASRRGAELLRMDAVLREPVRNAPPVIGRAHRNVRASLGLSLPKVIAFTPREEPIEVRRADVTVRVGESERDPIGELGFGKVLSAYLHRVNLGASSLPVPVAAVWPGWYLRQWLLRVH